MVDVPKEALAWLTSDDTGLSSRALFRVMAVEGDIDKYDYPRDSGDFGRCYRLLRLAPEWRDRIEEMANHGPYWKALAASWSELEALYEANDHDKLYQRMKEILNPIEDSDKSVVRLGPGVTMRFGK